MSISDDMIEKRKNTRVFFAVEEDIAATVSGHENSTLSIPVTLLSISPGGLSFMGNRYKLPELSEGDHISLSGIGTPSPLGPIDSVEAEVKYILDLQHNVRLSIGCEFAEIPGIPNEKIADFIRYRLKNLELDPPVEGVF